LLLFSEKYLNFKKATQKQRKKIICILHLFLFRFLVHISQKKKVFLLSLRREVFRKRVREREQGIWNIIIIIIYFLFFKCFSLFLLASLLLD